MDQYRQLKSLLLDEEQHRISILQASLDALLEETRDPEQIIHKIVPVINEVFSQTLQKDKAEFVEIFSPIIKDLLKSTIHQSSAEIAMALAPVMGQAISEQVKTQRDVIVDALYPVMGNMISKFVTESFKDMMQEINEKVQSTFSAEVLKRKITAKIKGVSEAELLLKSSTRAYAIKNIFLIHKETGILISERSASGEGSLEPEMVASMLTAIRSFVNDWISKNSDNFELNEIEFGDSTIRLEVAGCCYLAIVLRGTLNRAGQLRIAKVLEELVEKYSQKIAAFDGDTQTLPLEEINERLDTIFYQEENEQRPKTNNPWILRIILVLVISASVWGLYKTYLSSQTESIARSVIYEDPGLNLYAIDVQVEGSTIILKGRLPEKSLHERLLKNIAHAVPEFSIDDKIVLTNALPTYEETSSLLKAIIDTLNLEDGNQIRFQFKEGVVQLEGLILTPYLHERLLTEISELQGVLRAVSKLKEYPAGEAVNLFYGAGESSVNRENSTLLDNWLKTASVEMFLKRYTKADLLVIGHTDTQGNKEHNVAVARERSENVIDYLIKKGIPRERMLSMGFPYPPEALKAEATQNGRCVQIKWIKR